MNVNTDVQTLTSTILDKMPEINKWQSEFLIRNFDLQCRIRGRHNFKNMSRYSSINEGTFHNNYKKDFDFAKFNELLCELYCKSERVVAFDPSYISKSGKHTPGNAYFWSGCAGQTRWGLELGGFAVIDIINNIAMHLVAVQTLQDTEYSSLLDYYAALVIHYAEQIKIGGIMVVPVGVKTQKMYKIVRLSEKEYQHKVLGDFRFVPFVGGIDRKK